MKRFQVTRLILLVVLLTGLLAGCIFFQEKQVTYQRFGSGIDLRLTYYARKDRVTRQTTNSTILYSALGVTNKAGAKRILNPLAQKYQGIKGLHEKITYHKYYAREELSIDYTKVNLQKIKSLPGMYYSGSKNKQISLEKSEALLQKNKFVKVENKNYKKFTKKQLTQKPFSITDFNSIKLAGSSLETAGTTVAALTKELGRPDSSQKTKTTGEERARYLWYLSPLKNAYLAVYTTGERITTKMLSRAITAGTQISSTQFDALQTGISYADVIKMLGKPRRAYELRSSSTSYSVLTYQDKSTTTKSYNFYFSNGKLISKRES
ncbi:MAG: DUF1307 domain-containing protein [Liquorilactobacillus satsumensis]|uniref:DUF1307 domain-containing protein n=1 Tax=Liquorilactobacillus satsumensis TaxID=259059 RepID=UPI0039EB1E55